jgi:hypothetical protein
MVALALPSIGIVRGLRGFLIQSSYLVAPYRRFILRKLNSCLSRPEIYHILHVYTQPSKLVQAVAFVFPKHPVQVLTGTTLREFGLIY